MQPILPPEGDNPQVPAPDLTHWTVRDCAGHPTAGIITDAAVAHRYDCFCGRPGGDA